MSLESAYHVCSRNEVVEKDVSSKRAGQCLSCGCVASFKELSKCLIGWGKEGGRGC